MARRGGPVRYGVVGLGNIAQVAVLPAFEHARENSTLAALVSSDPTKLDELGNKYGVETRGRYEDFESVAKNAALDAVYLALPNHLHRSWTERAAAAGLHVLCEKPMALDESECSAMIDATRSRGLRLMVAYRLHFEKANLRAAEIARSGQIGEARFMGSLFAHQVRPGDIRTRAETGGGALYDLGVYCINAARSLFDDEPIEVVGFTQPGRDGGSPDVDETTSAVLRFPGGRVAQFTVSQGAADVSTYRLVGTEGDVVLEPAYEYSEPLKLAVTANGRTRRERASKRDQFAAEVVYFSRCILRDEEPEPSGEEGLADVRVISAIFRSAREARPVQLPPWQGPRHPRPGQEIHEPPVGKQETVHAPSPTVH